MSSCLCLGVSLGSAAALFPPLLLVVLNVSGVLNLHFPFGTTIASQEVAGIVVRSRAPCLLCWWPLRDHGTLAEPRWHECNPQSPDWALQVSSTHVCWVSISHALWIQLHGQDAEQFRLSLLSLLPDYGDAHSFLLPLSPWITVIPRLIIILYNSVYYVLCKQILEIWNPWDRLLRLCCFVRSTQSFSCISDRFIFIAE